MLPLYWMDLDLKVKTKAKSDAFLKLNFDLIL